jgi:hypothetical protein
VRVEPRLPQNDPEGKREQGHCQEQQVSRTEPLTVSVVPRVLRRLRNDRPPPCSDREHNMQHIPCWALAVLRTHSAHRGVEQHTYIHHWAVWTRNHLPPLAPPLPAPPRCHCWTLGHACCCGTHNKTKHSAACWWQKVPTLSLYPSPTERHPVLFRSVRHDVEVRETKSEARRDNGCTKHVHQGTTSSQYLDFPPPCRLSSSTSEPARPRVLRASTSGVAGHPSEREGGGVGDHEKWVVA